MDTYKKLYELFIKDQENVQPSDFARVIELSSNDKTDMGHILRLVYLAGKHSSIDEVSKGFLP